MRKRVDNKIREVKYCEDLSNLLIRSFYGAGSNSGQNEKNAHESSKEDLVSGVKRKSSELTLVS